MELRFDNLNIEIVGNKVIIIKDIDCCIICNNKFGLVTIKSKNICLDCIERLKEVKEGEVVF